MKLDRKHLEALRLSTNTLLESGKADGSDEVFRTQIEKVEGILAIMKPGVARVRSQSCQIPIPPSVNDLTATVWRGKGKATQVKTAKHKAFAAEAVKAIQLAMEPVKQYPVHLHLTVIGGKNFPTDRDIANAEKATTDALVAAGIIQDDCRKFVTKNTQEYIDAKGPSICFIEVAEPEVAA